MTGKVGRPPWTKLTPEVQMKVCQALAAGNYMEAAATYAGVSYEAIAHWIRRGKRAGKGLHFEFWKATERAQGEAEVTVVAQWRQKIPESWQAARAFLERRFPDRWGKKTEAKVELTGAGGGPIQSQVVYFDDEKRAILVSNVLAALGRRSLGAVEQAGLDALGRTMGGPVLGHDQSGDATGPLASGVPPIDL